MSAPQKRSLRIIFISVFFFFSGFFIHALFFPYLFTDNLGLYTNKIMDGKDPLVTTGLENKAVTRVLYEDGEFNPRVVQIKLSYYISIVNNSEKELMWLISESPLFRTPRGYGKSEELRTILYEAGTYEVSSKLHPQNILKVIVKP